MAVSGLQFGAQVSDWVRKSEARLTAVFRESSQRVVSAAQARCPVDTGYARSSIRGSLQSMPPIDPSSHGEKGGSYSDNIGEISLVIAGAQLGQTIYVGWTANYVGFLENGHSQQAPTGFVRLAALEWQRIINEVSQEAQSRAGG